ncbi:MAG: DUF3754 domain-containing protein [Planctomycetaceae bacterium]|nr:DUF3754 domain-containing protein [Planctomycetaceae bacterium]
MNESHAQEARPLVADDQPTSETTSAEHFIPFRRQDVIEMCLHDGGLPADQHQPFRELCEILTAYLHFDFRQFGDAVREHYTWFDPDRDTRILNWPESLAKHEEEVTQLMRTLAERANFFEVTNEQIEAAFEKVTLIDLSTHVDLEDFDRVVCFARGDVVKPTTVTKWFRLREVDVDVFERVILMLKFKGDEYFESSPKKRQQRKNSKFQPGAIYAYYYKDVPKYDIELLFPNVRISMNLRQTILFAVPAVAAAIGVLFKALPQLLIITAVILFLIGGPAWAERLGVDQEKVTGFMPVLTATIALVAALGGLAFKQWSSYRNKYLQFLKDVGEQLFFRNLATNRSVFARLIESAEEEETKEMILVLYHLLKHSTETFTREQLDAEIEAWMKREFGTVIDFDIDGPIRYLTKLDATDSAGVSQSVLTIDESGFLRASPMETVKWILDDRWDHFFEYANPTKESGNSE